MKKGIILLMAAVASVFAFSSCDDDDPIIGAYVKVDVVNLAEVPQTNTTVYMYKDTEPTAETPKADAKKLVVTNSDGVAEFHLNFAELNIIESQTSLYFVVFYEVAGVQMIAGQQGITVRQGDSREVEITIPI